MPACSIDKTASIAGTQPGSVTLTIKTTAASTAVTNNPFKRMFAFGGGTVAAILFLIPIRRRKWQSLLAMVLLVFLLNATCGCGGTNVRTPPQTGGSGTTPGNYVATVTGTSGTTTVSTTVPFAVQ
jgi:peptidoglycan/LPS O-acetylase OafA/YrhL